LVDKYEAQHPNVSIKIEPQVSTDLYGTDFKETLTTQISDNSTSTGPDIVRIHNTWTSSLQLYLAPLPSSIMSTSEYSSIFYPTAVTDLTGGDGKIYAIPLTFDGLGVYYNKDLLKKAGYTVPESTWDDLLEQAQNLTDYKTDGSIRIAGIGMGDSEKVQFFFEILSVLMLQEGSSIVDANGKTTFSNEENMEGSKAIKYYTDFVKRYDVWDISLPQDITMFTEGRLAMMIAPSWRVHDIQNALESKGATLDFDIAPLPQQPSAEGTTIYWADYWAEAVSGETKYPSEAWDFVDFISQPEQLRVFYDRLQEKNAFGEIYSRKDMSSEIISDKYVGAYLQMANTARSWKMVDRERMSEVFDDIVKDALSGGNSYTIIQTRLEEKSVEMDKILASGT